MEKLIEDLRGKFWTDKEEMKEELNELGYEVEELNDESVTLLVETPEETNEYVFSVITAGRTIAIEI